MADDNILAGVAGFTEGVSSVLVPYIMLQTKSKLERERDREKMQMQEAADRRTAAYKEGLELESFKEKTAYKAPYDLEQDKQKQDRENYLGYEDLTPDLQKGLGLKPEDKIRKEALGAHLTNKALRMKETEDSKKEEKLKTLPSRLTELIGKQDGFITRLKDFKNTIEGPEGKKLTKRAGWNTIFYADIPVVSSRYRSKVGTPDELGFKSKMAALQAENASLMTGANRGFREIEWLSPTMPSGEMTRKQMLAVVNDAIRRSEINRNKMVDSAQKGLYDVKYFSDDFDSSPMDSADPSEIGQDILDEVLGGR